jgi:hypothetical protein
VAVETTLATVPVTKVDTNNSEDLSISGLFTLTSTPTAPCGRLFQSRRDDAVARDLRNPHAGQPGNLFDHPPPEFFA